MPATTPKKITAAAEEEEEQGVDTSTTTTAASKQKSRGDEEQEEEEEDAEMTEQEQPKKKSSTSPNSMLKKIAQTEKKNKKAESEAEAEADDNEATEEGEEAEDDEGDADKKKRKRKSKSRTCSSMLPGSFIKRQLAECLLELAGPDSGLRIEKDVVPQMRKLMMAYVLLELERAAISMKHCKRGTMYGKDLKLKEALENAKPAIKDTNAKVPPSRITKNRNMEKLRKSDFEKWSKIQEQKRKDKERKQKAKLEKEREFVKKHPNLSNFAMEMEDKKPMIKKEKKSSTKATTKAPGTKKGTRQKSTGSKTAVV